MNIDNTEKTINIANFNVTYGLDEKPMLTYFDSIIFPAFSDKRHRDSLKGYYYFDNIEIKQYEDEYVLVGNLIKATEYSVRTIIQNDKLCQKPSTIPTAPYSRFIIFLRNHRMILVKNESNSPSIGSFQAHCRYVIGNYIKEKNKEREKDNKLPNAQINILNMPLKAHVSEEINHLAKISSLRFNFFPLNNDVPPLNLFNAVYSERESLGCKTSNLVFNSPKNKEEIANLITDSSAITKVTVKGSDYQGNPRTIKEGNFSSERKITIIGDVSDSEDNKLMSFSKNLDEMNVTSKENSKTYCKFVDRIRRLIM